MVSQSLLEVIEVWNTCPFTRGLDRKTENPTEPSSYECQVAFKMTKADRNLAELLSLAMMRLISLGQNNYGMPWSKNGVIFSSKEI